ncbi:hypothetical protein GCM10007108_10850 [Thermogymnomonas acidicola]|uniref:DUF1028 domain-containing protein n=1 Tax=Thermogymnomonas acidicola TaxID=399579 RepID=A0AA37BRI6_9ARCH|nr:DUF1028 domain-containing protein [Thermogymnomonas acidicola]GGM74713.1 hypothetical protein GCM10007108_10850 [Thermogymnomonas acidicola]
MTYSVVSYDPERKEWGVAVASRFLSVGSVVPWARAGRGAVATQAFANYTYGPRALKLLGTMGAAETLRLLLSSDPDRERRQVALVDWKGDVAVHTGSQCMEYAGHMTGRNFSVQGNILAGESVLKAMMEAMERQGPLEERLVSALEAAEASGGDRRGRQSAALLIVSLTREFEPGSSKFMDIRVEDSMEPVKELARLRDLWLDTFFRE